MKSAAIFAATVLPTTSVRLFLLPYFSLSLSLSLSLCLYVYAVEAVDDLRLQACS